MPAAARAKVKSGSNRRRLRTMASVRLHALEVDHLKQVATARSTTLSGLLREGLRSIGALPAPAQNA